MSLLATPAVAHFELQSPAASGGPGPGKGPPPCGPDVADGAVTPVVGGSQLMLAVDETTRHGGFYRVALALKPCKTAGCFPADNRVFDSTNQLLAPTGPGISDHAEYAASPIFPILADNLFPHSQEGSPESYAGSVTIPNVSCDKCTLQVIEFMAPHGPNGSAGYFYHHCADLQITADTTKPQFVAGEAAGGNGAGNAASGGAAATISGGSTNPSEEGGRAGGSGVATFAGASTFAAGGADPGAGAAAAPVPGSRGSNDSGGCGVSRPASRGAWLMAALVSLYFIARRRRPALRATA